MRKTEMKKQAFSPGTAEDGQAPHNRLRHYGEIASLRQHPE